MMPGPASRRARRRPARHLRCRAWSWGSPGEGPPSPRHRAGWGWARPRRWPTRAWPSRSAAATGHASKMPSPRSVGCIGLVVRRVGAQPAGPAFVAAADRGPRRDRHPRDERRRPAARQLRVDRPSTPIRAHRPQPDVGGRRCARPPSPAMQERGWGRVVAITSLAVRQPMANLILSNTARAGATGVPQDAGPRGRRGRRDRQQRAARARTARSGSRTIYGGRPPTCRIGDADDFGAIVAFLCSEQARVPRPAPRSTSTAAPTRPAVVDGFRSRSAGRNSEEVRACPRGRSFGVVRWREPGASGSAGGFVGPGG